MSNFVMIFTALSRDQICQKLEPKRPLILNLLQITYNNESYTLPKEDPKNI